MLNRSLSEPMKKMLRYIWVQSKKPGHTLRAYAVGMHKRSLEALANRGLLRRLGKNTGPGIPYALTAAGERRAVELFG